MHLPVMLTHRPVTLTHPPVTLSAVEGSGGVGTLAFPPTFQIPRLRSE